MATTKKRIWEAVPSDDEPIESRYVKPGEWWWDKYRNNDEAEMKRFLLIERMSRASVAAITDSDSDGYGSATIINSAYKDKNVLHIESGHGGGTMDPIEAMNFLLEYSEQNSNWGITDVYITDIGFDGDKFDRYLAGIKKLENKHSVHVYDHHNWDDEQLAQLQRTASDVDVRPEMEVCTTDIAFENLSNLYSEDEYELFEEFAAVVRDHDIWLKDAPISSDISDFSFWADDERFVDVTSSYGPYIMNDSDASELITSEREEKEERVALGVKNAEWYTLVKQKDKYEYVPYTGDNDGELVVALAYGDVYASEVGNRLVSGSNGAAHTADIAVIIQPWDKISFRSTDDFPKSAEIASMFNGGGHNTAAGGKIGCFYDSYYGNNSYEPYLSHWDTEGEVAKRVILEVMRVYFNDASNDE